MKAICTHDCQFRGVLVKADTVLEITEEEARTTRVKSSFRILDGSAPAKDKSAEDKPDERGMTIQNYRDRLTGMNVPFHATDGIDELRKIFDKATSQESRRRVR